MSIITGIFALSIAIGSIGGAMTLIGAIQLDSAYTDKARNREIKFLAVGVALLLVGVFFIGLTAPEVTG